MSKMKAIDPFHDQYELIELAPVIFKNVRRIHNIDDFTIRSIFSLVNINELDITISSGKGGSFFIKPIHGGRMLIKSITKPEYDLIKNFLNDYYCFLLMNPNTYLCPVLGVYKLKLQQNNQVPPISFILMRNVLNIDREDLSPEDMVYCFDLKGSVHGRRTLEDPLEILNYEQNYEYHKNLILKDIDFFQSFRKLDITNIQSERIMSQITEDALFLSQSNFMDYSLLLYIIIKPYKEVVSTINHETNDREIDIERFRSVDRQSFAPSYTMQGNKSANNPKTKLNMERNTMAKPTQKDLKRFERAAKHSQIGMTDDEKDEHKKAHPEFVHVRKLSDMEDLEKSRIQKSLLELSKNEAQKTLFMTETVAVPKTNKFTQQNPYRDVHKEKPVMVFKEKVKGKIRIYHISNVNDITNMKTIDQEEQKRIAMLNTSKFNSLYDDRNVNEEEEELENSRDSADFGEFFKKTADNLNIEKAIDINMAVSRPSASFYGRESMVGSGGGGGYGARSSIINFKNTVIKNKLKGLPSAVAAEKEKSSSENDYKELFDK